MAGRYISAHRPPGAVVRSKMLTKGSGRRDPSFLEDRPVDVHQRREFAAPEIRRRPADAGAPLFYATRFKANNRGFSINACCLSRHDRPAVERLETGARHDDALLGLALSALNYGSCLIVPRSVPWFDAKDLTFSEVLSVRLPGPCSAAFSSTSERTWSRACAAYCVCPWT
jgi:hypothetical protein